MDGSGAHVVMAFLVGIVAGIGLVKVWEVVRLLIETRRISATVTPRLGLSFSTSQDDDAYSRVEACKKRLRWQSTLNPSWVTPLVAEVPQLIREIAAIYHPNAAEPLRAPNLSHCIRAVHLAMADLADFLQTHRAGKLIDVSVNTAWKSWEMGRKLAGDERLKTVRTWYHCLYPWYSTTRPVWQVARYRSPWMWMNLAVSNLAIRLLQPVIVDMVARRAIELYSGRLAPDDRRFLAS
jgi:hypothetical protein